MNDFTLSYDRFVPEEEGLREALTSTGNGYFCTRGAAEWEDALAVHYPGTYAHGGYNRETTIMGGRPVLNEDLVNLPNWLVLKLLIEGEEAIGFDNVELLSYRHELNIRNAVVMRALRFRDRADRETTLHGRRFVSMAHVHDLVQRGYLGSEIRDGVLYFDPTLADRLEGLSFAMQFRRTPIRVTLESGELTVVADAEGFSRPVRVGVGDEVRELCAGDRGAFALRRETGVAR